MALRYFERVIENHYINVIQHRYYLKTFSEEITFRIDIFFLWFSNFSWIFGQVGIMINYTDFHNSSLKNSLMENWKGISISVLVLEIWD